MQFFNKSNHWHISVVRTRYNSLQANYTVLYLSSCTYNIWYLTMLPYLAVQVRTSLAAWSYVFVIVCYFCHSSCDTLTYSSTCRGFAASKGYAWHKVRKNVVHILAYIPFVHMYIWEETYLLSSTIASLKSFSDFVQINNEEKESAKFV